MKFRKDNEPGKWHSSKRERERERESYTLVKMAIIARKKQIDILKQAPKVEEM